MKTINQKPADVGRLKQAIRKAVESARRLWTAFIRAIRGREAPLPEYTGALRRTAITILGVLAVTTFLAVSIPGTAWGLLANAQTAVIENAEVHSAQKAAKAEQKKAQQAQQEATQKVPNNA